MFCVYWFFICLVKCYLGLKIPNAKVKSNQAEFFKVLVQLPGEKQLGNMMHHIQEGKKILLFFYAFRK